MLVLHDLNLAARYADHLIAMKDGGIVAEGEPTDVITEQTVADVFGMPARILADPVSGTPLVVPIGRHHNDGEPRGAHDGHRHTADSGQSA